MVGWMMRLKNKNKGCLNVEEEMAGEIVVLREVQQELSDDHQLVKQLKA